MGTVTYSKHCRFDFVDSATKPLLAPFAVFRCSWLTPANTGGAGEGAVFALPSRPTQSTYKPGS